MYNAGSESSTRIDRRLHLKTSDRIRVSGGTTDREELFVFLFSERFPIQLYFNHQCSSNVHRKEEKIYLLGCFLKSVESKMVGSAECWNLGSQPTDTAPKPKLRSTDKIPLQNGDVFHCKVPSSTAEMIPTRNAPPLRITIEVLYKVSFSEARFLVFCMFRLDCMDLLNRIL